MKKCSFCSEEVKDDAKKCRFCGEWLEGTMVNIKKQLTPQKLTSSYNKSKKIIIALLPIALLIFIVFGTLALFAEKSEKQKMDAIIVNQKMNESRVNQKKIECLQGRLPIEGMIVSQIGKELAEKQFREDGCANEDLSVDYQNTKTDERVSRCRSNKKSIDTFDYNQCIGKKEL